MQIVFSVCATVCAFEKKPKFLFIPGDRLHWLSHHHLCYIRSKFRFCPFLRCFIILYSKNLVLKLSYTIDFDKETLTKNLKLQLANHILYTKVNNNEYYVNSFMYCFNYHMCMWIYFYWRWKGSCNVLFC